MARINYTALEYANKGLTVGFIVAIVLANLVLITKIRKRGGYLYSPKILTMISLAIGDIFLAVFSLVFHARILFEDFVIVTCDTFRAYKIYMEFFIHFLYGCGLIVLLLELVYRFKTQPSRERTSADILKSVCCSVCPWILSILIVLPLTMAGITQETFPCFTTFSSQRNNAIYGVSILLPAAAVVLVAINVMFAKIPPEYYFHQPLNNEVNEQTALSNAGERNGISSQYNTTGTQQNPPSAAGEKAMLFAEDYLVRPPQHPGHGVAETPSMPPAAGNASNLGGQGFSAPQYPVYQQYPTQQQYLVPHHSVHYNAQSNAAFASPVHPLQAPAVFPTPGKERNFLIAAAFVYVACVVPIAVYALLKPDSDFQNSYAGVVLSNSFFWLSIFRSFLTPCIFSDSPTHI